MCVTTTTFHYAKGVAWAAMGDIAEATTEQELFLKTRPLVPASRKDYPNICIDELEVAEAMLVGEI